MTCKYFDKNSTREMKHKENYDKKVIEYSSAMCKHPSVIDKEYTTEYMTFHGACGKDKKFWKKRTYTYEYDSD